MAAIAGEATFERSMIDIRLARDDPDAVKAALGRRGVDATEVDALLAADTRARDAVGRRDEVRAKVNDLSRQVAEAKRAHDDALAGRLADESRSLRDEESTLGAAAEAGQAEVRDRLLWLPNLPSEDAPDGAGPEDNITVRCWPEDRRTYAEHQRVPHWEVGAALGILDMERGAKLSGSMFPLYRGGGARLLRALTAFALDHHADAFEEIRPPTLVRTDTMVATGQLPKFADDAYHLERDDLWAIPTAEAPLTSMYRDEILDEDGLPMKLTAATACFRREAGAAGRDTRGLLRVHEFDKVELFAYATADQAPAAHADMVERVEVLLRALDLEYRVLDLCTGDLGASSARTFDLEVYAPGSDMWLEVSSVSWFRDYQARRANIRYRPTGSKSPVFVHTLNGSALAWARIWAALMETGRQANGSVVLPDVLGPYLGGATVLSPS
jgi:seryl-tRNA synthetase